MKNKLYNKLHKKISNSFVCKIVCLIAYPIIYFLFFISYTFMPLKTKKVDISALKNKYIKKDIDYKINPLKENKLDLSIIVPIYNGEKYIDRCIESLLNQNTKYTYEIILINDGSTDGSLEIINKYNNLKLNVINKKNGGVSSARNVGIEEASGKYLTFVDADDFVENNYITLMMDEIVKGFDMVVCGYNLVRDDKIVAEFSEKEIEIEFTDNHSLIRDGYPWGKVYKKELFKDIRFPVGYYFEDTIMCYLIYPKARKVKLISRCLYNYLDNMQGATRTLNNTNKAIDTYFIVNKCLNYIKDNDIEMSEDLVKFTINEQLANNLNSRISGIDNQIQKDIFYLVCHMVDNMIDYKNYKYSLLEKRLIKSFKKKSYLLWKINSCFTKII